MLTDCWLFSLIYPMCVIHKITFTKASLWNFSLVQRSQYFRLDALNAEYVRNYQDTLLLVLRMLFLHIHAKINTIKICCDRNLVFSRFHRSSVTHAHSHTPLLMSPWIKLTASGLWINCSGNSCRYSLSMWVCYNELPW